MKRKLYFAFFRGKSFTSKIIQFFTRSNLSHVGYLYDETNLNKIIEVWPIKNNIIGFFKQKWRYNYISNHSVGTTIFIVELEVDENNFKLVDRYFKCLVENNTGYNWFGVIGFVLPFWKKGSKNGYFCSEGCVEALKYGEILDREIQGWKYSPDEFYELLLAIGGKTKTIIQIDK